MLKKERLKASQRPSRPCSEVLMYRRISVAAFGFGIVVGFLAGWMAVVRAASARRFQISRSELPQ